jgi:hypothetical protein
VTTYTPKEFAAHLATSGQRMNPKMRSTMNRAAGNIKRDWRAQAAAKNPAHARKYAGSIVMKRTVIVDGNLTITVTPRFGGRSQGNLGPVLEYGGDHSVAQLSNMSALERELPSLLTWLSKIAADTVR